MSLPSRTMARLLGACKKGCNLSPRSGWGAPADQAGLGRKLSGAASPPLASFFPVQQVGRNGRSPQILPARDFSSLSGPASPPSPTVIKEEAPGYRGSVRAAVKYQQAVQERLYTYLYPPPRGTPFTNAVLESHDVDIADARQLARTLSVDRHGFQIAQLLTALSYDDFKDKEKIESRYYAEVVELVRRTTGASHVIPFDFTLRKRPDSLNGRITAADRQFLAQQPVDRVHVDYTEQSGPERARNLAGQDAHELLQRRFAIVQVWRPLKGPVIDAPVAFCDASTATRDLSPMDLIFRDRVGQIYLVTHNPGHKWYYVPRMQTDEAVVFKCYDSDPDNPARFTPHTGFFDPTTPPGAEPRESIDVRTLAFW